MRWRASLAGLLFALAAIGSAVQAADFAPRAFKATYSTALNGMPLGIDLHLDLASTGAGTWELALGADSLMMDYEETSRFRWHECSADPLRYRFGFRGFGVNRTLRLDFDHATNRASGESRRGPVSFAFPADTTDELALTYAARCRLLQGTDQVLTFDVATTNGMKQLTYRVDGHETVKTPYGKLDTIRIVRVRDADDNRRTVMWVAPSLSYIMVKMEHTEKLGLRGIMSLRELEGIVPQGAAPR